MSVQAWGTVGAVVVAVLALIGTVYTARSARRGTDRSADIADRAEFTASYSKLAADLRSDRDTDRKELDKQRKRTDMLERRYWLAIRYIRQLRTIVVMHTPAEEVPRIPAELEQDI